MKYLLSAAYLHDEATALHQGSRIGEHINQAAIFTFISPNNMTMEVPKALDWTQTRVIEIHYGIKLSDLT